MNPDSLELVSFHLTGQGLRDAPEAAGHELRPALFAPYRDLTALRYDFPLVLLDGEGDETEVVATLSGLVERAIAATAPEGAEGEALRQAGLALQREIRALVAAGARGRLSTLWEKAEHALAARTDEPIRETLTPARRALAADGEVVDCDAETPGRVIAHAWQAVERRRARKSLAEIDALILKLTDILRADFMKSGEAHAPDALRAAFGAGPGDEFDFEAMARLVPAAPDRDRLPERRCARIRRALDVLRSQRFFARPDGQDAGAAPAHTFVFDDTATAREAYRTRLPEMVELVKAMSVAELEAENRYKEAKHDPFFAAFDETALTAKDLAMFPSYLVCLRAEAPGVATAELVDLLTSGLPVKVLVQTDDILEPPAIGESKPSFGLKGMQLASMAVGLNDVFVLQSPSSHLYQVADRFVDGLSYTGPSLFSVFSGALGEAAAAPPYLIAAAAMESRAFPAFVYDPAAGTDWASRFCIADNPQAEADWPVRSFAYEDEGHQRAAEDVAFTFVDFVSCDRRYARHFAPVPRAKWNGVLSPLHQYVAEPNPGAAAGVPYLLMVDAENTLQRVVVDRRIVDAARRCAQMWRSLQELGGIHNSHAARLVEAERQRWEEEKAREIEALKAAASAAEAPAALAESATATPDSQPGAPPAEAPAPEAADAEPAGDEPYVETPRCTTCHECIQINNRLFAYDDNQQAYIADPDAGTYRELVDAAESCQVCIIHPGKPRNPDEPGLDELMARAEPFM